MQRRFRIRNRGACGGQCPAGHTSGGGGSETHAGTVDGRSQFGEAALGGASEHALLLRTLFGSALCTIAAVERVAERKPIVALRHGVVRALQRLDRTVEVFGGVAIGTGGTGGVDGALRLIHFPCGWRRARDGKQEGPDECRPRARPDATRHQSEYISPKSAVMKPRALKTLAVNDRPREKLLRLGAAGLGDNELVAVVVGSGSRVGNALALASDILDVTGGLHGIPRATPDELRRVSGMGTAKAAQVLAAVELGRRTLLRCPPARVQIRTPHDAADYLLPQFGSRPVEQFGLMMLDTKHRLIRTSIISVGTLDSSPAHPREIFREAASACAAAIVLFHNHPSGDPQPSRDDVDLTTRLVQAGEIMGIDVIDHVILADNRYFSFREAGRL